MLVGTWIDQDRHEWTFNSDGIYSIFMGSTHSCRYEVVEKKIVLSGGNPLGKFGKSMFNTYVFDIAISTDGRTLVLDGAERGLLLQKLR